MTQTSVTDQLKSMLQIAIEVEHATLPPYLTACWSIHGNSMYAQKARNLILSVIREEMLHMAMACNILNAIGGRPNVNGKNFIPQYPAFLPGHSHTVNACRIHLLPCNKKAIKTFLQIEMPEQFTGNTQHESGWSSIGEFYRTIIHLIGDPVLKEADFQYGKQVGNEANPAGGKLLTVSSRKEAIEAINEILDQGEGHDLAAHYDKDNELTHYWKFREINAWMESGEWDFSKEVYPLDLENGDAYFNAEAKALNQQFNSLYSQMLDQLDTAFGSGTSMDAAITTMLQLNPLAAQLVKIPLTGQPGNCGPAFEYIETARRKLL